MASTSPSFGLVLVFLVAALYLLRTNGGPAVDFGQWCQRTTHNITCSTAIESDSRSNLKTPNGLCTILKYKAINTVGSASDIIDGIREDPQTCNAEVEALQNCADAYYRALLSLSKQNFTVLDRETYPELNILCERVFNATSDCESYFKPPLKSPLQEEDRIIANVAETIAEILNLSQCNQSAACPSNGDLNE